MICLELRYNVSVHKNQFLLNDDVIVYYWGLLKSIALHIYGKKPTTPISQNMDVFFLPKCVNIRCMSKVYHFLFIKIKYITKICIIRNQVDLPHNRMDLMEVGRGSRIQ